MGFEYGWGSLNPFSTRYERRRRIFERIHRQETDPERRDAALKRLGWLSLHRKDLHRVASIDSVQEARFCESGLINQSWHSENGIAPCI